MITNVRSALFVEEVRQDEGGRISLIGVKGNDLTLDYRPGFLFMWLAMVFDTDGRPTKGHVNVRAPDYSASAPFDIPAGHESASWNMQVAIPVTANGLLTVSVRDTNLKSKPIRLTWRVGFTEEAVDAPAAVRDQVLKLTDSAKATEAGKAGSLN
jgi:hypothetical protein